MLPAPGFDPAGRGWFILRHARVVSLPRLPSWRKPGTLYRWQIMILLLTSMASPGRSQSGAGAHDVVEYLRSAGKPPAAYVTGKFSRYDVVLLGEDHAIRDNLKFVTGLIPTLYDYGVYAIAMEFGASEDQAEMDSLVAGGRYDEQKSRDMMFDYNVGWAYKEYIDMARVVWEFNRRLPAGARKFRVINMSYIYDWTQFPGRWTPEARRKVFLKGDIDSFRAAVITREILDRGEKVLILTGTSHAFTGYRSPVFKGFTDTVDHYGEGWLGNILLKKFPGRVFSVILHQPFSNQGLKKPGLLSPSNGMIEKAMNVLGDVPMGFDLDSTPAGMLADSSEYALGYPSFRLGNLFDGYVFLKPINELEGCTIDTQFFEGRSWEIIMRQFPDPDWHTRPATLKEYWQQIRDYADLKKRYKGLMERQQ